MTTWDDIITKRQEEAFLSATLELLELLLKSPEVKDIREDIVVPLSKKIVGGDRIVLTTKGLQWAKEDNAVFPKVINEEDYEKIIKKFEIVPSELINAKKRIEADVTKNLMTEE